MVILSDDHRVTFGSVEVHVYSHTVFLSLDLVILVYDILECLSSINTHNPTLLLISEEHLIYEIPLIMGVTAFAAFRQPESQNDAY